MKWRDHARRVMKSFSPRKYRELSSQPLRSLLGTVLLALVWCLLLMLIVGSPKLWSLRASLDEGFASFETFSLEANVSMVAPVTVSQYPLVRIDLEQQNRSREAVLFTKDAMIINKVFSRHDRVLPWSSLKDVAAYGQSYTSWLVGLAVLLLPSLLLVLFLLFFAEAAVAAALGFVLCLIVTRVARFSIGLKSLLKIAVVALVPFLVLQVVPLFYVRWILIPWLAYVLLIASGTWFVGESRMEKRLKKES